MMYGIIGMYPIVGMIQGPGDMSMTMRVSYLYDTVYDCIINNAGSTGHAEHAN